MTTSQNSGTLVITRHSESEWNLLGKWTGLTDVSLTDKGKSDSRLLGEKIKDIDFDAVYTSDLRRTHQTLAGIYEGKNQPMPDYIKNPALNERDYGDMTGKNKWEVQAEVGDEAFTGIRRGWEYPVPGGENLHDVYERAVPYFQSEILPRLQRGENVLVVSHGNTIRALIKYFDQVSDHDIESVEMPFTSILIYQFEADKDLPVSKETRSIETTATHA